MRQTNKRKSLMRESATNPVGDFFVLLKEFSLSPDNSERRSRYGSNKSGNACLRKEGEFLFLIMIREEEDEERTVSMCDINKDLTINVAFLSDGVQVI